MSARIPRCLARLLTVALGLVLVSSCGSHAVQTFYSSPKPVSLNLDAQEVKILETRFHAADVEFAQGQADSIRIEGEIVAMASDQRAADLRVAKTDLGVIHGRVTMISLPQPDGEFAFRGKFRVEVPKNVNLRVVQGEGSVVARLDLPLMTEIELGTGSVRLDLPKTASAFVSAQVNIAAPPDFVIADFNRVSGEPIQQLTRISFDGQIGTPLQLVGSRLEVRVNAGVCKILGVSSLEAIP